MPKLVDGVQKIGGFVAALKDIPGTRPVRFYFGGIGKDGPEDRGLGERCIASEVGPPLIPGFDNNYIQIFQGRDHVVILNEQIHDARTIPLDVRPPLDGELRAWFGYSRGRWEGDTLVVETSNFNDLTPSFDSSGTAYHKTVTERFTRVSDTTVSYAVTLVDPQTFQDRIELSFPMIKTDHRLYEFACHEGNYSMDMILRGARKEEQDSLAKTQRRQGREEYENSDSSWRAWRLGERNLLQQLTLALPRQLLLQLMQGAIARQHLSDARVRLAPLADCGDELAVLQLDAVHRHVDFRDVDGLVAPGHEVVVACDVGAVVADVAEERAERSVVVERERQRADRAARSLELDRHVHRDAELRMPRSL